jgi:ClpP class serine protease
MTDKTSKTQRKFERNGPMAVRMGAVGILLDCDDHEQGPAVVDGIATVTIRGPLVQHAGWFWDSYEAILSRVTKAFASDARTVMLKIHSPGGDVYGTFETARAMRAMSETSGKPLISFVEGEASSAAYALACAAERICLTSTSMAGSVGVIQQMCSFARGDAAQGVDIVLVTSGARKADGNPGVPITDDTIAAQQVIVDDLAGEFFRWVKEARGVDAAPLQAGVFVGDRALGVGLADEITTESNLRATLTRGTTTTLEAKPVPTESTPQAKGTQMQLSAEELTQFRAMLKSNAQASKYTDAMGALAALAEEGNEDAKAAIKKMLGTAKADAEDGDGDKPEKKDGDKPEEKAAKAEGDKEEPKKSDPPGGSKALRAVSTPDPLETEVRARLIDSRPDLKNDAKIQAMFAASSLEALERAVKTLPKAEFKAPAQPAKGTVGKGQGDGRFVPSGQKDRLAEMMGLGASRGPRVTRDLATGITVFGGSSDQIQKILGADGAEQESE